MNANTVSPSNGNGHATRATNHKRLVSKAERVRELLFLHMDATDDVDFVRLHEVLTQYLAFPREIRLELDRMDYGDNKGVITQ